MLEGEKITHELDLNRNVHVKIKTKRLGEEFYSEITVKAGHVSKTPPRFSNKEEVAELIGEIDLEDEQTAMDLEGGEEDEDKK